MLFELRCLIYSYIRLGMLEECGNHIETCLGQISPLLEARQTTENKLKLVKYLAKLHLQYCAILSQQSKHREALEHAKYGCKYIHHALRKLRNMVEGYAGRTDLTLLESVSTKLLPIMKELTSKLVLEEKQARPSILEKLSTRIDAKSLFGFTPCSESALSLNIGNIMQLSPLNIIDVLSEYDRQLELTRESIFEKISLLVVSYFCLSTEKRFLSQEVPAESSALKESEFYHAKALEMACCFLPPECPLVTHVFMSYQKHYSVVRTAIVFLSFVAEQY